MDGAGWEESLTRSLRTIRHRVSTASRSKSSCRSERNAAKALYEKTRLGWTPGAAALNEEELSFLEAIQAARRHPDPDEIAKWLGWEEADRTEARLRPRLHRPSARIDRFTIHFADRLSDSDIGL